MKAKSLCFKMIPLVWPFLLHGAYESRFFENHFTIYLYGESIVLHSLVRSSQRYTREIPDLIQHPCNGVVSHGAQIGGFRFLPTTHAPTYAKQMRPRPLCVVQHFTHVYLHAQTTEAADDIRT